LNNLLTEEISSVHTVEYKEEEEDEEGFVNIAEGEYGRQPHYVPCQHGY
jgi:hypothetical protein